MEIFNILAPFMGYNALIMFFQVDTTATDYFISQSIRPYVWRLMLLLVAGSDPARIRVLVVGVTINAPL